MPDTHILAILLVLVSAVMHMAWNMLLKQCTDRLVSIWLFLLVGVIVFLPLGLVFGDTTADMTAFQFGMFALSGFLKAIYFVLLGYLYETGDFSKAYPIARAAHVFVPFLAFIFLGEPLRPLVLLGVFILWIGILFVNMPRLHTNALRETARQLRGSHSLFALLTAAIVALYSIVDTAAVADMDPLLFLPLMFLSCLLFLGVHVIIVRNPHTIFQEWQRHCPTQLCRLSVGPFCHGHDQRQHRSQCPPSEHRLSRRSGAPPLQRTGRGSSLGGSESYRRRHHRRICPVTSSNRENRPALPS